MLNNGGELLSEVATVEVEKIVNNTILSGTEEFDSKNFSL